MAEANKAPKKRRVIRKAETLREQTEKRTKAADKPRRGIVRTILRTITAPLRFIARQIAKLGRFKVFRVIGYILVPPYFRNSWKELRQVTWPGRKETWKLTFAVLIFSAALGILVTVVDFGLDKLFKRILLSE